MARVVFSEALMELPAKLADQLRQALPQMSLPVYRVQLGLAQQKLITFSQTPLPEGQVVELSQTSNGQLQARPLPQLNLSSLIKTILPPVQLDIGKLPISPPDNVLRAGQTITPQLVQSAIADSGQWFEQKLQQLVNGQTLPEASTTTNSPINAANKPAAAPTATSVAQTPISNTDLLKLAQAMANTQTTTNSPATAQQNKTDINQLWGKFQGGVKTMGNWLDSALQGKTPPPPKEFTTSANLPAAQTSPITPPVAGSAPQISPGILQAGTNITASQPIAGATLSIPLVTDQGSLAPQLQQDVKGWLIQVQHHLQAQLNQHLLAKGDSTRPWLADSFKTAHQQDLQNLQIWPRNISWQPVLLGMLENTPEADDAKQDALVKLLLQVSQGLGRIQQDQISNRQQQSVSPQLDLNLQLPYLEQQQLRFVQVELQEKSSPKAGSKQMLRAWHMILRFAQAEPFPFAIELNMHSMQVNLHCWAEQQSHLHQLREKLPTLRAKLLKAGFTCQQLDTRLGNPPPLKRQIQQYQVDIHT
ncbi:MAG: hypothetical protein H7A09_10195 [Oceanospirillaceae bacterium]|nr:hypothetical protein [Oceanospirillaceae bacterium]